MSRRVVIIGAGPGGLASTMLLAKAGADVTILEKQPRVGGRTSLIEADGYKFDLGPTFFLYPQILQEIFQEVRRDLFKEVPMTKLDPQYRLVFGAGGELLCTSKLERMVAEIANLAPADAPQSRRFMTDNRRKLEKFTPVLQSPFSGWTWCRGIVRRRRSWFLAIAMVGAGRRGAQVEENESDSTRPEST